MNEYDIIKALSETKEPRATLYLNEKRVDELYQLKAGAISEIVRNSNIEAKLSAKLLDLFGGDFATSRGITGNINVTPILKAILLEYEAKQSGQLTDVSYAEPQKQGLIVYIGQGLLLFEDQAVSKETIPWRDTLLNTIQVERIRQEKILQRSDPDLKTLMWVGRGKSQHLASVISSRWFQYENAASYMFPPYGILGRIEREIENILFISPLWIWHDG